MRERAKRIGAHLLITDTGSGTLLDVTLGPRLTDPDTHPSLERSVRP